MDDACFDGLTRFVGGTGARRGALRVLAGGLLAAAGLAANGEADAKKKRKKKKKRCKCPAGSGKVCPRKYAKNCICPEGQEDSGGVCGTPPTCNGSGETCPGIGPDISCCSGFCIVGTCDDSGIGQPCHNSDQCAQGECRGFVCVAP